MTNENKQIQDYFKQNKYVIVRQVIPKDIINLFYSYSLKKANRLGHRYLTLGEINDKWDGHFGDERMGFKSYNFYGDEFAETILENLLPGMELFTGEELVYTYGYLRLYQDGDTLPKHIDRDSCEISTTLCVGYDATENWPIYVETDDNQTKEIFLEPGDLLVYKGCEIPHYRNAFKGNHHVQCFLHYNKKENENNNYLDGRSHLGLPKGI